MDASCHSSQQEPLVEVFGVPQRYLPLSKTPAITAGKVQAEAGLRLKKPRDDDILANLLVIILPQQAGADRQYQYHAALAR